MSLEETQALYLLRQVAHILEILVSLNITFERNKAIGVREIKWG